MLFPNISPEIFAIDLFGFHLALRWYAMAYIVGILIGWRIILAAVARPQLWASAAPLNKEHVDDLLTSVILGVIIGGRLGSVLFYYPEYYLEHPMEILQVWNGGMSFHGGFLGVVVAVILCHRRTGAPLGSVADCLAIATPTALLLGRIANFINGELWGRPTDLPWGIAFPGEYAACPGVNDICYRHPSQLYEAALEGLLLAVIILTLAFRRGWLKSPWRLTGLFIMGYGMARFAVEFVRQPDAQFQTVENPLGLALHLQGNFGLTMGQILSVPMIMIGAFLLWSSFTKRKAGAA